MRKKVPLLVVVVVDDDDCYFVDYDEILWMVTMEIWSSSSSLEAMLWQEEKWDCWNHGLLPGVVVCETTRIVFSCLLESVWVWVLHLVLVGQIHPQIVV